MENDDMNLENAILYADSSRGVYIPRFFATTIRKSCVEGIDLEDLQTLIGRPVSWEFYWGYWQSVLDNAIVTDPSTGQRFSLYQDGDLWLVPIEGDS
jgi:hypothetical protein